MWDSNFYWMYIWIQNLSEKQKFIFIYVFNSEANPIKFRQLLVQTTRINKKAKVISTVRSLLETLRGKNYYRLSEGTDSKGLLYKQGKWTGLIL